MTEITQERVLKALEAVKDPDLGISIVEMGMIKDVVIEGTKLSFSCELTTPNCPMKGPIEQDIRRRIAESFPEVADLQLKMTARPLGQPYVANPLPAASTLKMKHILLIGGGKGGVGKSTCALNLAVALKSCGHRVALLDADIYSPTIPHMVGIREKPRLSGDNQIQPFNVFGVELMSMGFLIGPGQPMVWRAPVLNGVVTQFLEDVSWSEGDFMLVDLPPGTGDIVLSMAQNCPAACAVLVSAPQGIAVASAVRAKAVFDHTHTPVIGLIENMATGPGEACKITAEELCIPFLGSIPNSAAVCASADAGIPIVVSQPDSDAAKAFRAVAEKLAVSVSVQQAVEKNNAGGI
jgi:ATP-binding protein involved in chromosome partitioning